MNYTLFYCISSHEIKGTGMKIKFARIGYMIELLQFSFYRCSMRAPWVAQQTYLYSIPVHTLLSKSRVAFTQHPLCAPKGKARGISGEWDCQMTGLQLQIHFSRNLWLRSHHFLVQMWSNSILLEYHVIGPSSCRIGMRNSSNISGYTMPVALYSAKKKRPENFLFEQCTKHIQLWTVSCTFSSFRRTVFPPDPQVVSTNISW